MKLFLRSIFFFAIASFAPDAFGQTIWYYTPSGDFNTASNWTDGVPNSTTTGIIDPYLGSTYTVSISTGTSQSIAGLGIYGSFYNTIYGFTPGIVDLNLTNGSVLNVLGSTPSGSASVSNIFVDYGGTLNFMGGTLQLQEGEVNIGDTNGSGALNLISTTFNYDFQTTANYTSLNVGNGLNAIGTVTESTSNVIMGNEMFIGTGGGTGTYTLQNGSTLQTGTMITTPAQVGDADYYIVLGSNTGTGQGSAGTLTLLDSSTLSVAGNSALLLGTVDTIIGSSLPAGTTGGSGTIVQNGALSTLSLNGSLFIIGGYTGGTGNYNLMAGTLTASNGAAVILGETYGAVGTVGQPVGATGTINQSGGTMTFDNSSVFVVGAGSTGFAVGTGGTGTYNLSGGSASFADGFYVGTGDGATGTVNQSGGTLSAGGPVVIGGTGGASTGVGTYTLGGGTAVFADTVTLNTNGTLAINGGTFNVGGTLTGSGALNFGGGTLNFTNVTSTTFNDTFSGGVLAANTVSTVDTSAATSLTNVIFANPLSGGGGITFIGNGTTTFSFTNATANSYTGPTTITNGILDISGGDIANSSALNIIGTPATATVNLTLTTGLGFAGSLGGGGQLNVNFNATGLNLVILNPSSFTGSINLSHGTDTGTLQVYSGAFSNITGAGSNVVIGGAPLATFFGTPTIPSTGTVTFTNPTYTGTTTINSGFTLNTTNLDGNVANSGTLNVTGTAGIVGNVTSNSGTLNTTSVTGNVTNSGIFIASASANTVTGNLTNSGTVMATSPLPSVIGTPTFTIGGSGNLTQTSTGTLDVRISGLTSDYYQINGAGSSLAGTIHATGSLAVGTQTYTVVNAPGGVTDNGLTVTGTTALFEVTSTPIFAPTINPTTVSIEVTQLPIGLYALTPNQLAVANAIDSGIGNTLKTLFNQIPTDAAAAAIIPGALDQLSPESLQYARNIAFENSTFLAERMNGVDADLRAGYGGLDTNAVSVVTPGFDSGLGRSLGSLLASDDPAFHQSAPNGVNYYQGGSGGASSPSSSSESTPTPTWDSSTQVISDSPNPYIANQNPSSPQMPRMSEFIGGDVILADLNQNQNTANSPSSKASYTAGDVTAGVSFRMNSHLAAGVLIDYNHTDATTDSSGSKTTVDSYSPGLFATYFDHGFYVNGLASFGYNTYSNTRDIGFVGATASSHPTGQQYVGDLDFGYDFHPAKNWVVGPTVGLTYTHLNIDSFTETGASPADLTVDSQSADSLRSRLGGHVIFQTNTGDVLLQPNITAMWQHEYLDSSSGITSSFSDFSSSPFTIQTAAPSRDSALIGVGLTATLSTSMALYLNYFADIGASDYYAQSVVGGLKARF